MLIDMCLIIKIKVKHSLILNSSNVSYHEPVPVLRTDANCELCDYGT